MKQTKQTKRARQACSTMLTNLDFSSNNKNEQFGNVTWASPFKKFRRFRVNNSYL
jgi:hypothetical protein